MLYERKRKKKNTSYVLDPSNKKTELTLIGKKTAGVAGLGIKIRS